MKNSFDAKLSQLMSEFELMCADLKKEIWEMAGNFNSKYVPVKGYRRKTFTSYANIFNRKSMAVVRPKDSEQTNAKTKSDIMKSIDPVDIDLKVSGTKQIKGGGILISCDDPKPRSLYLRSGLLVLRRIMLWRT